MKTLLTSKLLARALSVIHPVLFAVFPILFLYAHNAGEVPAGQILRLMLYSVVGTLGLWLLLRLFMKNAVKTGLATTVCVIFFFSYGRLYDLLVDWGAFVPRHSYLLPAALLVLGYWIYLIRILRLDLERAARILNVAAVALILMNLAGIALYEARNTDGRGGSGTVTAQDLIGGDTMPDIYYIILDEYAHPDTMLEYYDYDNSGFINELVDMGFYVASNSRVVYPATWICVSSALNMEHFDDRQTSDFYYQKISQSAVAKSLRSIGYTYVYFGSSYDTDRYRVDADVYYNFFESSVGSAAASDFSRTLWNTTMARPFYDYLTGQVWEEHYRSALLETVQCLETVPHLEGPKFVFAHVMCPHIPFVFGANGEYVDPSHWYNREDKQFYLGQYRFISEVIKSVVTTLLEESSTPPIVIIQSDHGLRSWVSGWSGVGDSEWQKVLNAYYLPGDGKEDLHDSISPDNSFRVILNHYFGAHYDLLED